MTSHFPGHMFRANIAKYMVLTNHSLLGNSIQLLFLRYILGRNALDDHLIGQTDDKAALFINGHLADAEVIRTVGFDHFYLTVLNAAGIGVADVDDLILI